MACKRLEQPPDEYDKIAAAWAVEIKKMDPQQQIFAKRAINEILFEGQMGALHRNSVEINATRSSTPFSVQSAPSYCPYASGVAPDQPDNVGSYFATYQ